MTSTIVLPVQQKYLIGLGGSIAAGCQPCALSFTDAARKAGACDGAIHWAVEAGLAARQSATADIAAFANDRLPDTGVDAASRAERTILNGLIAVAAAIAGSTACRIKPAVDHARAAGASDEQIKLAVELARAAKRHAEREAEGALQTALGGATIPECTAPSTEVSPARPAAPAPACGCRESPDPASCAGVGGERLERRPRDHSQQAEALFETVRIEKARQGCSLCEDYAEKQAEKAVVVMSCEGACLRGEISRQAANHLCFALAPEKTARLCLGGAFTKDAGQRSLVRNARHILALEGCPIRCASRMMRGHFPDLDAEVIVTDGLCDFDRSLFGIDALPPERARELGRVVAAKVAAKLLSTDRLE